MDKQKHNDLIKEFAECQKQTTNKKLSKYTRTKAKRRMKEISDIFDKEYSEPEDYYRDPLDDIDLADLPFGSQSR